MTPHWAPALLSWNVWALLSGLSLLLLVASALAIPWLVRRIRADYLLRQSVSPPAPRSPGRVALRVLKNGAGLVLFLAGVAMLALPGQGVLTMVAALFLLDVPGKRRILTRVIAMPTVLRAINALRRRANVEPLLAPRDSQRARLP